MALVDLLEVKVACENPAPFGQSFEFDITFECLDKLEDDLEWKLVYVGSAGDDSKDQVLGEVTVGPVPVGTSKFALQAESPEFEAIPEADRLGVTVVSITGSYKEQAFVNVGYYVSTEYYPDAGPTQGGSPLDASEVPKPIDLSKVYRNVVDEPRVTRYTIKWSGLANAPQLPEPSKEIDEDEEGEEEEEEEEEEDDDRIDEEDENVRDEDDQYAEAEGEGDVEDEEDDEDEDDEEDEEDGDDEDEIDLEAEDEEDDEEPASKRHKSADDDDQEDD